MYPLISYEDEKFIDSNYQIEYQQLKLEIEKLQKDDDEIKDKSKHSCYVSNVK